MFLFASFIYFYYFSSAFFTVDDKLFRSHAPKCHLNVVSELKISIIQLIVHGSNIYHFKVFICPSFQVLISFKSLHSKEQTDTCIRSFIQQFLLFIRIRFSFIRFNSLFQFQFLVVVWLPWILMVWFFSVVVVLCLFYLITPTINRHPKRL